MSTAEYRPLSLSSSPQEVDFPDMYRSRRQLRSGVSQVNPNTRILGHQEQHLVPPVPTNTAEHHRLNTTESKSYQGKDSGVYVEPGVLGKWPAVGGVSAAMGKKQLASDASDTSSCIRAVGWPSVGHTPVNTVEQQEAATLSSTSSSVLSRGSGYTAPLNTAAEPERELMSGSSVSSKGSGYYNPALDSTSKGSGYCNPALDSTSKGSGYYNPALDSTSKGSGYCNPALDSTSKGSGYCNPALDSTSSEQQLGFINSSSSIHSKSSGYAAPLNTAEVQSIVSGSSGSSKRGGNAGALSASMKTKPPGQTPLNTAEQPALRTKSAGGSSSKNRSGGGGGGGAASARALSATTCRTPLNTAEEPTGRSKSGRSSSVGGSSSKWRIDGTFPRSGSPSRTPLNTSEQISTNSVERVSRVPGSGTSKFPARTASGKTASSTPLNTAEQPVLKRSGSAAGKNWSIGGALAALAAAAGGKAPGGTDAEAPGTLRARFSTPGCTSEGKAEGSCSASGGLRVSAGGSIRSGGVEGFGSIAGWQIDGGAPRPLSTPPAPAAAAAAACTPTNTVEVMATPGGGMAAGTPTNTRAFSGSGEIAPPDCEGFDGDGPAEEASFAARAAAAAAGATPTNTAAYDAAVTGALPAPPPAAAAVCGGSGGGLEGCEPWRSTVNDTEIEAAAAGGASAATPTNTAAYPEPLTYSGTTTLLDLSPDNWGRGPVAGYTAVAVAAAGTPMNTAAYDAVSTDSNTAVGGYPAVAAAGTPMNTAAYDDAVSTDREAAAAAATAAGMAIGGTPTNTAEYVMDRISSPAAATAACATGVDESAVGQGEMTETAAAVAAAAGGGAAVRTHQEEKLSSSGLFSSFRRLTKERKQKEGRGTKSSAGAPPSVLPEDDKTAAAAVAAAAVAAVAAAADSSSTNTEGSLIDTSPAAWNDPASLLAAAVADGGEGGDRKGAVHLPNDASQASVASASTAKGKTKKFFKNPLKSSARRAASAATLNAPANPVLPLGLATRPLLSDDPTVIADDELLENMSSNGDSAALPVQIQTAPAALGAAAAAVAVGCAGEAAAAPVAEPKATSRSWSFRPLSRGNSLKAPVAPPNTMAVAAPAAAAGVVAAAVSAEVGTEGVVKVGTSSRKHSFRATGSLTSNTAAAAESDTDTVAVAAVSPRGSTTVAAVTPTNSVAVAGTERSVADILDSITGAQATGSSTLTPTNTVAVAPPPASAAPAAAATALEGSEKLVVSPGADSSDMCATPINTAVVTLRADSRAALKPKEVNLLRAAAAAASASLKREAIETVGGNDEQPQAEEDEFVNADGSYGAALFSSSADWVGGGGGEKEAAADTVAAAVGTESFAAMAAAAAAGATGTPLGALLAACMSVTATGTGCITAVTSSSAQSPSGLSVRTKGSTEAVGSGSQGLSSVGALNRWTAAARAAAEFAAAEAAAAEAAAVAAAKRAALASVLAASCSSPTTAAAVAAAMSRGFGVDIGFGSPFLEAAAPARAAAVAAAAAAAASPKAVAGHYRESESAAGAVLASLTAYELLGSARLKSEDQSCLLDVEERLSATITNTGESQAAPSSPRRPMQESSLVRGVIPQAEEEDVNEGGIGEGGDGGEGGMEEEDLWGTAARWDEIQRASGGGWGEKVLRTEDMPPAPTVTGVVDWGGDQLSESDHDESDYRGNMNHTFTAGPKLVMCLEPISERASQEGELVEDNGKVVRVGPAAVGAGTAAAMPKAKSRLGGMVSASSITLQELADISKLSLTDPSSRTVGRGDDGDDDGGDDGCTAKPTAAAAVAAATAAAGNGTGGSTTPNKKKRSTTAAAKAKGAVAERIAALELAAAAAAAGGGGGSGADGAAVRGTLGPCLTAGRVGRVGGRADKAAAVAGGLAGGLGGAGRPKGLGAAGNKANPSAGVAAARQLREVGTVQGGRGGKAAAAAAGKEAFQAAATAAAAEAEAPRSGSVVVKAAAASLAKQLLTGDRLDAAAAALEGDNEEEGVVAAAIADKYAGTARRYGRREKAAGVAVAESKTVKGEAGGRSDSSVGYGAKGGKLERQTSATGKRVEGTVAGGGGKAGGGGGNIRKQGRAEKSAIGGPAAATAVAGEEDEGATAGKAAVGRAAAAGGGGGGVGRGKQARAERLVALMAAIESAAASKPSSALGSEQDTGAEAAVAAAAAGAGGFLAPMHTREIRGGVGDGVWDDVVAARLEAAAAAVEARLGSDGLRSCTSGTLDSTVGAGDFNGNGRMHRQGFVQAGGSVVSGLDTITRLEAAAEAIEAKLGSPTLTRALSSTGSILDLSSGYVHRLGLTIRTSTYRKSEVAAAAAVAPAGDQGAPGELWSAHFSPVAEVGPKVAAIITGDQGVASELWSAHFGSSSPFAAQGQLTRRDQLAQLDSGASAAQGVWSERSESAELNSTAATVATGGSEQREQLDQGIWSSDSSKALAGGKGQGSAGAVSVPGLPGAVSPSKSAEGQRRMVWAQGVKVPQRIRDVVNGDLMVQGK